MGDLKNLRKYFRKHRNKHWMIISATLLGLLGINNLTISRGHDHEVSADNDYVRQDNQSTQQSVASSAVNHAANQVSGLNAIASSASTMGQSIASNSNLPASDANMFSNLADYVQSSAESLGNHISASASLSASASVASLQQNSHVTFSDTHRTYSVPNYNPGGSIPAVKIALFHAKRVVWHDGSRIINLKRHDIQVARVLSSIHSDNEVVYVTNLNGKVGYVYGVSKQKPKPLYLDQRYVYLSVGHQIMNINTLNLVDSRIIETIQYANSNLVKYCVSTKYGIGYIYVDVSSDNHSDQTINDQNKESYPRQSSNDVHNPTAEDLNKASKKIKPRYTNDQKIDILRSQINSLIKVVQSDQKRIDSLLNLLHR